MKRRTLVFVSLVAAACLYTGYRSVFDGASTAPEASPIRGSGSAPGDDGPRSSATGATVGADPRSP